MGRFEEAFPLDSVIPADYNPRRLSDQAFQMLQLSIKDLGIIRPIIVAANGTIIAGHQRTRSMKALGITHAPAWIIDNAGPTDEIRFNQIHNSADVEFGTEALRLPRFAADQVGKFVSVEASQLKGPTRQRGAAKRNELMRLLTRYGQFSSAVALESGELVVGLQYAVCCHVLGMPILTYVLPSAKRDLALLYFGESYGQFSYDHLPRTTWGQTLAQMFRIREGAQTKNTSTLYERVVMPQLKRTDRILDFGAGQKDYAKLLKRRGHDIVAYEPYFRRNTQIDVTQVHRDIDRLCEELRTRGRFDVVVCDSVLNSVDTLQAQQDVLVSLSALCRPGGTIYFSGRSLAAVQYTDEQLSAYNDSSKRATNFFDADGFTAIFSRGVWRYQKMHGYNEICRLAHEIFGCFTLLNNEGREIEQKPYEVDPLRYSSTWKIRTLKRVDLPQDQAEAALTREFDMPLPGDTSYDRSADILDAWHRALELERDHPLGDDQD